MSQSPISVVELDGRGTAAYIAARFGVRVDEVRAVELGGGVSNNVVLVEFRGERLVLKQSLPQLRVKEPWYSDRSRVFREARALREVAAFLPEGSVPAVLFEDREQFAFAMTAAQEGTETWKAELLRGEIAEETAETAGRVHAALIRSSWGSDTLREAFGDQKAFDQLRLDPYYRFTAQRHPDLEWAFDRAIGRCRSHAVCLVHGDWSPKNLLVSSTVMAIDFEVTHFGDPAFDVAFLLNHLLLKRFLNPQWSNAYSTAASVYWNTIQASVADWKGVEDGVLLHLPLLLLARVDGKSPVEYLREPAVTARVRAFARRLLKDQPGSVTELIQRSEQ